MGGTMCFGLLIMFCEPTQAAPPVDTYCSVARPIRWSAKDTRLTKEQVDTHNRQWKVLCGKPATSK